MPTPARRFWNLFISVPAVLCFYAISIASLLLSYQANTRASIEAEARSTAIEAQNIVLRNTFCGILEGSAFPPPGVGPPQTEYGRNQRVQFAEGARYLGCTPDVTDRQ